MTASTSVKAPMNTRLLVYIVLQALCLMYFLLSAGTFNSLGMVIPSMVEEFGMSWAQAGFGFTLLGTACGIISLAPAFTIRKLGVGRTLLTGTVILFAGFGLLYASTGVGTYYLGTTLLGVGYCFCGTVPAVHVLSSTFKRRSTVLGIYFTIGNLGAVAGPMLYYGSQSAGMGWRSYWLMFAIASVVIGGFSTLVASRLRLGSTDDGPAAADARTEWTVRAALSTPQFWVVVFAYTACLAINTTTHGFAYQHLLEHAIAQDRASQLISLSALVCAIGSALAGVVGEKTSPRALVMFSLGCLGVSAATLAVADGPLMLILWMVTFGGGLGFSYVSTVMLLQEYFGRRASLELYSIMMAVSTSAALGPALGGAIKDQTGSFSGVFFGLAAVSAVLFCAVAVLRKPAARAQIRAPLDEAFQ
ncbi:CynX/NimT family MFS transporter [Novosphingobium sp. AP12]|uniref:MFS transporter n=1 Tax=Novosphingobium sp. AP12 TaxID=1144305 RepID=UPI0002720A7E|nr:MFS transporter [Novosphingobium sp. AP12]EJL32565.1 cyanate permease [Novosphingobium sp. AP12]